MAEKYIRSKVNCNIGTIGHVDHGKTTLTAAITRVLSLKNLSKFVAYDQIDNAKEEKARGITINASHVEYETLTRHYTHIDCPGHENYIKNMITGATQMDGAILVVSVVDGIQKQTCEHILLASQVGIPYLVIFFNKCDALGSHDLVSYSDMDDFLQICETEIAEILDMLGYPEDEVPKICGSAKLALEAPESFGKLILDLLHVVDLYIKEPTRAIDEPFLMSIKEVHSIAGRGTVVTGNIEKGKIKPGDEVSILGLKEGLISTTCTGLEMFHKELAHAYAGENVGILVRGVDKDSVTRGQVICEAKKYKVYNRFTARLVILTPEEGGRHQPFVSNYKPQFYFRTADVSGIIYLPKDHPFGLPGEVVTISVKLEKPMVLEKGLRFAIREGSKTIGAGLVFSF